MSPRQVTPSTRRRSPIVTRAALLLAVVTLTCIAGASAQQPTVSAPPIAETPSEAKGPAIVPPLARKAPPPAKTSVPIVAPPARKPATSIAPAAAKPQPKAKSAPSTKAVKGKATPPAQKSSLGGAKGTPPPACAKGFAYEVKLLRCVKTTPGAQKAAR